MRSRFAIALAGVAVLALTACGGSDRSAKATVVTSVITSVVAPAVTTTAAPDTTSATYLLGRVQPNSAYSSLADINAILDLSAVGCRVDAAQSAKLSVLFAGSYEREWCVARSSDQYVVLFYAQKPKLAQSLETEAWFKTCQAGQTKCAVLEGPNWSIVRGNATDVFTLHPLLGGRLISYTGVGPIPS